MADESRTFSSEFIANVDGFVQSMRKASDSSDSASAAFTKSLLAVEAIEAAAKIAFKAVSEAVAQVTTITANYGDEMLAASQKTGIAVDQLGGLRFAAEQGNASFADLSGGLRVLARNLDEANQGSKAQADAFTRLGIATKDAHGNTRPLNDVFLEIADRFKSLPDGAEKTSAGMALLGKNADSLTATLNEGSKGLQLAGEKARFFGAIMSTEAAAAGDAFNDSLGELQLAGTGLAFTIGEFLLPTITKLVQAFSGVIASVTAWVRTNPEVIKSFVSLGETIIAAGVEATSLALQGITDLISGVAKLADIVGLGGIAGKLKTAADFTQNLASAIGLAGDAFINGSQSATVLTTSSEKLNFQLKDVGANADAAAKATKEWQKALAEIEFARIVEEQNAVNLAYSELIRIWTADAKAAEDLATAAEKLKVALDTEQVMHGWEEFQRTQSEMIRIWMAEQSDIDKKNQEISDRAIELWKNQEKQAETTSKAFSVALGNVTSDFVKSFADILFEGKKFGETMENLAKTIAKSMFTAFVTGLFSPLTERLASAGRDLARVLDIGGGAGSAVSSAAGSGGGSTTGGGGGGAGGGAFGVITGIAQLGIGIVNAFQNARQEGTLNAIEASTRFTSINLTILIDQFMKPIMADVHQIAYGNRPQVTFGAYGEIIPTPMNSAASVGSGSLSSDPQVISLLSRIATAVERGFSVQIDGREVGRAVVPELYNMTRFGNWQIAGAQ